MATKSILKTINISSNKIFNTVAQTNKIQKSTLKSENLSNNDTTKYLLHQIMTKY